MGAFRYAGCATLRPGTSRLLEDEEQPQAFLHIRSRFCTRGLLWQDEGDGTYTVEIVHEWETAFFAGMYSNISVIMRNRQETHLFPTAKNSSIATSLLPSYGVLTFNDEVLVVSIMKHDTFLIVRIMWI